VKPLRLLLVSARYPPYVGGTEIHTAEVATRLVTLGHHVSVLTTDPTGSAPAEEVCDGVRVLRVPAWPRARDWYVAPKVASVVAGEAWDVLHVQGYHTFVAPLAMAAAARQRRPFVVTFHSGGHSSRFRHLVRPVQRRAMRPLLRRASRLIGVSPFETALFERALDLPPERFATISNGTSFHPAPRPAGPAERPIICSVGRVERYKGHSRVVAALPELRRSVPDVLYRVIGSGPYADRLLHQAERLGVRDAVELMSVPRERRDELPALLQEAAVFLLLSDYESQGIAVLEALSVGVPVLVADTSALHDLTGEHNVWVVPPNSPPAQLADAILEVMAAPRQSGAPALPDWDDIVAQLVDLYRDVLEAPACGS
jgi:glycosyltransferase involved in cell wall biosynthesis